MGPIWANNTPLNTKSFETRYTLLDTVERSRAEPIVFLLEGWALVPSGAALYSEGGIRVEYGVFCT